MSVRSNITPRVFVKPIRLGVEEEVTADSINVDDGAGIRSKIEFTRKPKEVGLSVLRSTENDFVPARSLTPAHPNTVIAGVKIRASFSPEKI